MTAPAARRPAYAPMRPAVAQVLGEAADADPALVVLGADGYGLATQVRDRHPRRYIDVGIAEANLVGVASGLARSGRPVVVGTMAPFLVRRAAEQIRNDVCNPGLNVTFLGVGGGVSYGTLGPTHHVPEDLGFFSGLPNTRVFCPTDVVDAAWAVREALAWPGPAYVRLGAREDRVVHPADREFRADGLLLAEPGEALAVATGVGVPVALDAAGLLAGHGVRLGVLALPVVKPFPAERVRELATGLRAVAVVEEHLDSTGITQHTARALVGRWQGAFLPHAVDDSYPPLGDRAELLDHFGITAEAVAACLLASLGRRSEAR
ncbi:transketolase family protein [Streptantibioticus silvisoli]|uniref:Transketolase C-terminal domain-containing protein n=1 Tax=Streptantibioticus silvisoli TaxID=2705255 RepID=A0ABT6VSD2_9ACTN|nr:transketolase C-terminal domain-containing protein [Streptantibioticus silvisoli]MDI5961387.1 transketolase C-terminal domain-containing protein [Streptantibioticus silvisoli]